MPAKAGLVLLCLSVRSSGGDQTLPWKLDHQMLSLSPPFQAIYIPLKLPVKAGLVLLRLSARSSGGDQVKPSKLDHQMLSLSAAIDACQAIWSICIYFS